MDASIERVVAGKGLCICESQVPVSGSLGSAASCLEHRVNVFRLEQRQLRGAVWRLMGQRLALIESPHGLGFLAPEERAEAAGPEHQALQYLLMGASFKPAPPAQDDIRPPDSFIDILGHTRV